MPSAPAIRRARKEDQERIGQLWRAFLDAQAALDERFEVADDALERFHNDFPAWLEDETRRVFVAEAEGAVSGFVTAHRWGPPPIYADASEVYVNELYVIEAARRQGAGGQLVEAVRGWAEEVQADRLRLSVLAANAAGRAFWGEQGAAAFFETLTVELSPDRAENDENAPRRPIGFR